MFLFIKPICKIFHQKKWRMHWNQAAILLSCSFLAQIMLIPELGAVLLLWNSNVPTLLPVMAFKMILKCQNIQLMSLKCPKSLKFSLWMLFWMPALINISAASDGAGRVMVCAREKPVYPSLSQLACQSTCCFTKPQLSFLITNWVIWTNLLFQSISSNSPGWQAYHLQMDNSNSFYSRRMSFSYWRLAVSCRLVVVCH